MKKLGCIISVVMLLSCIGCEEKNTYQSDQKEKKAYLPGEKGYWIQQKYQPQVFSLTNSGKAIATYVWKDGDIIESWYDDFDTITDSIKNARLQQAKEYISQQHKKDFSYTTDTIINMNN